MLRQTLHLFRKSKKAHTYSLAFLLLLFVSTTTKVKANTKSCDNFVLAPPQPPVAVVSQESAVGTLPALKPEVEAEIGLQAEEFLQSILRAKEINKETLAQNTNSVHLLGDAEIKQAAQVSNHFLQKPAQELERLFGQDETLTSTLTALRRKVEDLDPARQSDIFHQTKRRFFGLFPAANKMRDYFDSFRSSQDELNAIIHALESSQKELIKDNQAIETEKANAWHVMTLLQKRIYLGKLVDAKVVEQISQRRSSGDEMTAKVLEEDLLFYVRQRLQDMTTQLAVTIQGYLALDMVRKNNLELINGVDRATTTTISALRTAVIVAQALANQKLVLDQIDALNTTTSHLIEGTSALLKTQAAAVLQQASSSGTSVETLQRAFQNIYQTMDMVSEFKTKSLANMQTTIEVLSTEIEKSKPHLDRIQREIIKDQTGF